MPYNQTTSKNGTSGPYSSLSALEQIKDMMIRGVFVDCENSVSPNLTDSRRLTIGKARAPRRAREDRTRKASVISD